MADVSDAELAALLDRSPEAFDGAPTTASAASSPAKTTKGKGKGKQSSKFEVISDTVNETAAAPAPASA